MSLSAVIFKLLIYVVIILQAFFDVDTRLACVLAQGVADIVAVTLKNQARRLSTKALNLLYGNGDVLKGFVCWEVIVL